MDLFDNEKPVFKIDQNKTVRFISLFSGIGFQELGLKYLGVNFEYHKAIEFDKYAIEAFNCVHGTNIEVTDVTKIKGEDLEITDKDKYTYLLSYSFPCTDLSVAGLQLGMEEGSGTRSSLLWEVKRLLDETKELPDVLIMENVTAVHGTKNRAAFEKWISYLESKGYSNYWNDMNCLDFGIPQSRNRCFMVSILGDYRFDFPDIIPLDLCMEDLLIDEEKVADKFCYNSEKTKKLITDMFNKGELPYAESNYRP